MQYLNARESAPAHRHTAAAIRFVLQGQGVWTTVNGEPCPMSRGDLVLTPSMAWHEHHSGADEPMVWFDGLDLPLVNFLDASFFEPAGDDYLDTAGAPAELAQRRPLRPPGAAAGRRSGHRPALAACMVYRWEHTEQALTEVASATSSGDAELRFIDPVHGRDALPTMRCAMRRLAPGVRTPTTQDRGQQHHPGLLRSRPDRC